MRNVNIQNLNLDLILRIQLSVYESVVVEKMSVEEKGNENEYQITCEKY